MHLAADPMKTRIDDKADMASIGYCAPRLSVRFAAGLEARVFIIILLKGFR